MNFLAELENLGVDVKEGLDRVMGDESLYEMMFGMFVTTLEANPIREEEFDAEPLDELIGKVHTLKGTTGNLSITPLFVRYERTLTLLRENQPAKAKAAFQELLPVQNEILDCIRRCQR